MTEVRQFEPSKFRCKSGVCTDRRERRGSLRGFWRRRWWIQVAEEVVGVVAKLREERRSTRLSHGLRAFNYHSTCQSGTQAHSGGIRRQLTTLHDAFHKCYPLRQEGYDERSRCIHELPYTYYSLTVNLSLLFHFSYTSLSESLHHGSEDQTSDRERRLRYQYVPYKKLNMQSLLLFRESI